MLAAAQAAHAAFPGQNGKIAFQSDRDGNYEIYTMNADGSAQTNVTTNAAFDVAPAWSPDGTKIAFTSSRDFNPEIYTMNADGSAQTNVSTNAAWDLEPDWSPDGTKIAFQSDRDGNAEIYTINADGGAPTNVTTNAADDFRSAWSPDGTKIAFTSYRDGNADSNAEIYTMSADGSAQTRRTNNLAQDVQPDWQPIPINAYPRPKGASPLRVSLVTAYDQCTAPNRTHGPPLAFGSCSPPAKTSAHLTVGTGDSNGKGARNEGYVRLSTIVGNPGTPADEADVGVDFFSDDVFNADLTDYTGELRAELPLRITDRDNTPHPGGPGAATTEDFTFDVDATCVAVADPQDGSSCQTTTTLDALMPGAIKEGRRSIWQLGQVVVYDGGPDGETATADNTVFARQGVFIP